MEAFGKARRSTLANALVEEAAAMLATYGHPFDLAHLPRRIEAIVDAAMRAGLDHRPDAVRFTRLACRYFGETLECMPPPVSDILYANGVRQP